MCVTRRIGRPPNRPSVRVCLCFVFVVEEWSIRYGSIAQHGSRYTRRPLKKTSFQARPRLRLWRGSSSIHPSILNFDPLVNTFVLEGLNSRIESNRRRWSKFRDPLAWYSFDSFLTLLVRFSFSFFPSFSLSFPFAPLISGGINWDEDRTDRAGPGERMRIEAARLKWLTLAAAAAALPRLYVVRSSTMTKMSAKGKRKTRKGNKTFFATTNCQHYKRTKHTFRLTIYALLSNELGIK